MCARAELSEEARDRLAYSLCTAADDNRLVAMAQSIKIMHSTCLSSSCHGPTSSSLDPHRRFDSRRCQRRRSDRIAGGVWLSEKSVTAARLRRKSGIMIR